MSVQKGEKPKTPRKNRQRFSPEIEQVLQMAAKEAAGKPLSETLNPDSGSLLTQFMGRIIELAMQEEMTEHLGYQPYERLPKDQSQAVEPTRSNSRNGHYKKTVETTNGTTVIEVPRDRDGSFEPQILPKGQRVSHELEQRIISMLTCGMSTRDIGEHLTQLYGTKTDSQFVSRLTIKLDDELTAWRNRPLEAVLPIVFVDAIHLKVRHSHGVHSTAVYQVCAYNEDGKLEIVGLYMAPEGQTGEGASFWHQVFVELHSRGVKDILFMSADGLEGLEKAARALWPEVSFQPCVVHLVRASMRYVVRKDWVQMDSSIRPRPTRWPRSSWCSLSQHGSTNTLT